jgi:hypothetical protein
MADPERFEEGEMRATNFTSDLDTASTTILAPIDRVRWPAVFAGLVTVLSVLAVLTILGLAIGLAVVSPGNRASQFGLGAGIWGIITALIAFIIGGWLAARTAAVRGRANGVLNGAMVWAVTIPLLLYWLIGGLGSLVQTTATTAAQGATAAATTMRGGAAQPAAPGGQPASPAQNIMERAKSATGQVSGQDVERTATRASTGAWGVFITLILGLIFACLGGWLGARPTLMVRHTPHIQPATT